MPRLGAQPTSDAPPASANAASLRLPVLLVIVALGAVGGTETDIWGHLRFGLDMLRARAVPYADPYAFTSVPPWINHEWGSQVLFAIAYRLGGLIGLTAVKVGCAAVTIVLLNRRLRVLSSPWREIALLALIAALIQLTFSMRPHLLSLPLYTLTLTCLLGPSLPWWLPAVFVFWANLHGGWLIGCVAVAAYVTFHPSVRNVAIAAICLLATLVNPYGIHLWTALVDAMRGGLVDVAEWQPAWKGGVQPIVLWSLTTLVAFVGIWRTRRKPDYFRWLWMLLVGLAALRVQRHGAFYALTVAMFAPRPVEDADVKRVVWTPAARLFAGYLIAIGLALAAAILHRTYTCMPPQAGRADLRPEASATAFIRTAHLTGRMLTWYNWGEYAIWHVGDLLKVSMDNREKTVYDDETVARHREFYDGRRPAYADEIGADYVWLERNAPPVAQLQGRGWFVLFSGPRSTILGKASRPTVMAPVEVGLPCFPQP